MDVPGGTVSERQKSLYPCDATKWGGLFVKGVGDEVGQMVIRQPLPQCRWQQHLLVWIIGTVALAHHRLHAAELHLLYPQTTRLPCFSDRLLSASQRPQPHLKDSSTYRPPRPICQGRADNPNPPPKPNPTSDSVANSALNTGNYLSPQQVKGRVVENDQFSYETHPHHQLGGGSERP